MRRTDAPTSWFRSKFLILLVPLVVGACKTPRPGMDYVLAQQAYQAAKEVDAARYAPGFYHKAEESYRRGVSLYNNQKYEAAIAEFREARIYAEKAENTARLQRQKSGDEGL